MNAFISILIGGFVYIGFMWLLLAVMRLDKTPQDDNERIDTIRDELDRQEQRPRKVRAAP